MITNYTKLRVGISIGPHHGQERIWPARSNQNAFFLAEALDHCPNVSSVTLVNTASVKVASALAWDTKHHLALDFDDALQEPFDVFIELGGQLNEAQVNMLKQQSGRLVSHCGNLEYVRAMESMLFNQPKEDSRLFTNQRYDSLWTTPQVENISRSYFEVLQRQESHSVPFVWSPVFLQERTAALPHRGEYQPRTGPRRLSVMEPNTDIANFCLYPTLIAESAYRARPDDIAILQVTSADHIAKNSTDFAALMNRLDIVQDKKAVFLGHRETPAFLAENTDIVISHQLENPLDTFHLEVCWQGYPLVHNAYMCSDLGYYYESNDVVSATAQVFDAMDLHDTQAVRYREQQRVAIGRYAPDNVAVTTVYSALLDDIMSRPARQ